MQLWCAQKNITVNLQRRDRSHLRFFPVIYFIGIVYCVLLIMLNM